MTRGVPSLESLRILVACVAGGGFTAAARALCLTPAAVSLRIRTLEADLGTVLFVRSGPRVEPTDAAQTLAGRLREGFDSIERAVEAFRGTVPPLRVTAPPSFAARWLVPRLPAYQTSPDAVRIEVDASAELRPATAFDVAVRTGRDGWPGLEATPLSPVEATPMLSPALAASVTLAGPADLARLPLLPHPDWQHWFAQACGDGVPALRFAAIEFATHELNAGAALDGQGVALLSPLLYAPLLAEGRLVRPFACQLSGPDWHHALVRAGERRPAVLGFRSWLVETVRAG